MKKVFVLIFGLILLTGCKTIPVTWSFPDAPPSLMKDCSDLSTLQNNAKLSDVGNTTVNNFVSYHECRLKNKEWRDWYTQQKTIYDKATKK